MRRAPAQNRVLPTGQIVSVPARGAWMGNRGQLHHDDGNRQVTRASHTRTWLICTLDFKSRVLPQWQAGHNTQLFFHDEAVALAAGHRPCAECRRPRFNLYRDLASQALGRQLRAPELDSILHTQRQPGSHVDPDRYWVAPWGLLPTGTFVIGDDGAPELVVEGNLVTFDVATYAYQGARPRPKAGAATVLTPPLTVQVMTLGYRPHISAQAAFARANPTTPALEGELDASNDVDMSTAAGRPSVADGREPRTTMAPDRRATVLPNQGEDHDHHGHVSPPTSLRGLEQ